MKNNSYEVILADTEESKNIHYNLRYQIFCLEKGFEEASKCKDEMEKDIYDDNAIHFLVKGNNRWIGSFRLVIDNSEIYPFRKPRLLILHNSFNVICKPPNFPD